MSTVKIIGIKKQPSSKNPDVIYHTYFYTSQFSDYDLEHAQVIQGVSCGSEFANVDIGCQVGDEVEFAYTKGFQDKAVLVGCRIVKPGQVPVQGKLPDTK